MNVDGVARAARSRGLRGGLAPAGAALTARARRRRRRASDGRTPATQSDDAHVSAPRAAPTAASSSARSGEGRGVPAIRWRRTAPRGGRRPRRSSARARCGWRGRQPPRELADRGLSGRLSCRQRCLQGRVAGAVDQVLAAQRSQQASVGRVRLREVVHGERGRDRPLDRVGIAERGPEALLRAAHRADPHRGEQIIERRPAVVDRALGRAAGGDDAVQRGRPRAVVEHELARGVEDPVGAVQLRPRHVRILDGFA